MKIGNLFFSALPYAFTLIAYLLIGKWLASTGVTPGPITILMLLVGLYGLGVLVTLPLKRKLQGKEPRQSHPALNWPVSGPISILGHGGLTAIFYGSSILTLLNPLQLVQQMRMLKSQSLAARRLQPFHQQPELYKNQVGYRLPFAGEWLVFNGGLTPETSHSWEVLSQRYAYDFVRTDDDHKRHCGSGTRLTDYYAYGEPILAAADGEVVALSQDIGASPLVGFGILDFMCRDFRGNHIVIRHAEDEYGFYAHLQKGSVPWRVGDKVRQGDRLGLCGHSGHSSEPHLHFHLQDRPDIYSSLGVPIRFSCTNNDTILELVRGQRVSGSNSKNPGPRAPLARICHQDAL